MKTRNHSIALYEQKIKGLEVNMHGLMQVWHLHDDLGFRFAKERGVTWPNDYELVCGLDTDCPVWTRRFA